MGKFRKNVIEENEIETVFKILDDFKRRHSLLSEKIEDTYEQGYKFLDRLEKQLILGKITNYERNGFEWSWRGIGIEIS